MKFSQEKIAGSMQNLSSLRSPSLRFESRKRGKTNEERRKRRVQYSKMASGRMEEMLAGEITGFG